MSRRKLLLVCLLLVAIRVAVFVVPAFAGDGVGPDPGGGSNAIGPILESLI